MNLNYYVLTDKGNHPKNEDAYQIEHIGDLFVFALADGIGSLPKADIAATLAVTELLHYIHITGISDLHQGFDKVNQTIYNQGQQLETCMATTLLACAINSTTGECTIAHVGDSRAYIFGSSTWKTKDHSLVQELVELGILTENGAFCHPEKHRLKQAIGSRSTIKPDIYETLLDTDSIIVLCTDGVHDYVKNDDIEIIALSNTPKQVCENLIDLARSLGNTDDITILTIHYEKAQTSKPKFTRQPEKTFVIDA